VRLGLELDRAVLPAGEAGRALLKISLEGVRPTEGRRAPVNLALVIDKSGSMAGEKVVRAREAALEAVRRLAAADIVSLVVFDSQVRTLVPARRVGDGRALEQAIREIQPGGYTALYGGVSEGAAEVRRHLESGAVPRIILLSDGIANVGPSSPEDLARLGSALRREGISVTTVGLGLDFNEDLMARLAQRSDGNHYFVEHSRDLPRIFQEELGDVLSVVARRAVVEIEFPGAVRPLRLVGREGTIEGQRLTVELSQLYAGQEKFALVEVEFPATRAGATLEVARAQVRYEDALSGARPVVAARAAAKFSSREPEVLASVNARVQLEFAANLIALAKDEAIALADAGRPADAAAALAAPSSELRALSQRYRNSALDDLAAKNELEAQRLAEEGLDNSARKSYRAESTQTLSQQRAR
jgi:Ca-activated chloride channel family protein